MQKIQIYVICPNVILRFEFIYNIFNLFETFFLYPGRIMSSGMIFINWNNSPAELNNLVEHRVEKTYPQKSEKIQLQACMYKLLWNELAQSSFAHSFLCYPPIKLHPIHIRGKLQSLNWMNVHLFRNLS